MQVTNSLNTLSFQIPNKHDFFENLNYDEKKTVKEALMKVPDKELPELIKKLNKIPLDEHYVKKIVNEIINTSDNSENSRKGFELYA